MSDDAKPLALGEPVRLAGGGTQTMVITKIEGESAECSWQDKNGKPYAQTYPLAALRRWKATLNITVA